MGPTVFGLLIVFTIFYFPRINGDPKPQPQYPPLPGGNQDQGGSGFGSPLPGPGAPGYVGPGGFQQQPQGGNGFGGLMQGLGGSGIGGGGRDPSRRLIRKSLREMYKDLFHPEKAHDDLPSRILNLPDLSHITKSCNRNSFFFSMNPQHQQAIEGVKAIIMSFNNTEDRINSAFELRHNQDINLKAWYYALSSCSIMDPELSKIDRPSPLEIMPDMFINAEACRQAERGQNQQGVQPSQPGYLGLPQQGLPAPGPVPMPMPVPMPGFEQYNNPRVKRQATQPQQCILLDGSVGADNGIENRLWYFREDLAVNAHHWYWHLIYPPSTQTRGDRRGELFFYMHWSMIARYNAERLSNGLSRVSAFPVAQGAVIDQGFFAHLTDINSGQSWSDRSANVLFTDILHQNNPNLGINIVIQDQILTALNRIQTAIDQGAVQTTNGGTVSLRSIQGVDILGDIVQSNAFSLNNNFYALGPAGLHNSGHVVFSEAMDPRYQTRTPPGPMADAATSMRDMIFYRWHTFINGIFDRHKRTFVPYAPTGGELPLSWPSVQIVSISVLPWSGGAANQLRTFWNQIQFPFSRGLDLTRDPNAPSNLICARYLDHGEFIYQIVVDRQAPTTSSGSYGSFGLFGFLPIFPTPAPTTTSATATVRIFMAPRFDEQGNRFSMAEQRYMFFVVDTFTTTLNVGRNTITRNSTQSSLTVPWDQLLRETNNDPNMQTPNCGCGWPQHLLLPKGTPNGMIFDLFVMITDGTQDAVQQSNPAPSCKVAPLHCGIPNGRYPDAKPMGYPFDRLPYAVNGVMVPTLDAYVNGIPNMETIQVTITSQN